jgi:hypothetical protein
MGDNPHTENIMSKFRGFNAMGMSNDVFSKKNIRLAIWELKRSSLTGSRSNPGTKVRGVREDFGSW